MVLFVSKPAPCKDHNDGTMLVKMNIPSRIHKLDCIALDGGYNGFVSQVVETSDTVSYENFSYPVRKTKGIALTDVEAQYNAAFGGFRSSIESFFGDLQSTFSKFTHNAPVRFADEKVFDLQFKLCCLLMNLKKMVELQKIPTETHHTFWMQDGFDFQDMADHQLAYEKLPNIKAKLGFGQRLLTTAQPTEAQDLSMDESAQPIYEVFKILDHRGEAESMEYLVHWKGYSEADATWEPEGNFNQKRCIEEYWKSKAEF
ncbi:hypothetical protein BGX26_008305 [Mortierella sp. AD094]|nr:hypothetical protein BGX26_008305 [Mortierella sp. AD094]